MRSRVPIGTLTRRRQYAPHCACGLYGVMQGCVPSGRWRGDGSVHRTAPAACTVLCNVTSLSGRRPRGYLSTALRGLCPLVPCYARSCPYRDKSPGGFYLFTFLVIQTDRPLLPARQPLFNHWFTSAKIRLFFHLTMNYLPYFCGGELIDILLIAS